MRKYYPVMLDIINKTCIIIGGGSVATRKVKTLMEYKANIIIISDKLSDELKYIVKNNNLIWKKKKYSDEDLDGAFLVFAATDDQEVNNTIYKRAKAQNILINIVDAHEKCTFIVPSKIEQGDLTIAISTNGKSPMLTKKIKEDLSEIYTPAYAELLSILGDIREKSLKEIPDITKRKDLFHEIVYSDIITLLNNGKHEIAMHLIDNLYQKYKSKEE